MHRHLQEMAQRARAVTGHHAMSAAAELVEASFRPDRDPGGLGPSRLEAPMAPGAGSHGGPVPIARQVPDTANDRTAPVPSEGLRRTGLARYQRKMTEPHFLFPAVTVIVLGVIWATTLTLVRIDHAASRAAAIVATREIAETYEAQVARSVREIDQTLKFIKHACRADHGFRVLGRLKAEGLLPPELVFAVSIADAQGNIVDSIKPVMIRNVADRDYFRIARTSGDLVVGRPRRSSPSDEWHLRFVRRLDAPDGRFAGVVMVAVDSAYFVSGYEAVRMGDAGILGMLGADGVFRARRIGDTVSAGDHVDYAKLVPRGDGADPTVELEASPWDGIRRFTASRELFNQSLAVVVGLSEDEQLAPARARCRSYLWIAAVVSALIAAAMGAMGYLSWRLALDRRRAASKRASDAERIEFLAYHDPLTRLPNRRYFASLLHRAIEHAKSREERICMLFIDLDGFKEINDTLGHEAGDQLLQGVAARTRACLRDSDTVARLGGDEFVALLPQLREDAQMAHLAQKILRALSEPFDLCGTQSGVTASIGISRYPLDGIDADSLSKSADSAMYEAKHSGKNRYCFHGVGDRVRQPA